MKALRYRLRYWFRRTVKALGFCPDCGNVLNRTSAGRRLCPYCK
jgi:hypothetical protein